MPSLISLATPFLTAIAKLSSNSTNASFGFQEINTPPYLTNPPENIILPEITKSINASAGFPQIDTPPYLTNPIGKMILPGIANPITPPLPDVDVSSNHGSQNTVLFSAPNNISMAIPKAKAKGKGKLAQVTHANTLASTTTPSTITTQNTGLHFTSDVLNFQKKSAQLTNLINQYTATRNVLFDSYAQFQNDSAIARYGVREICLSIVAATQRAQKSASYFEEIITDESLTQDQINTLQKTFNDFKAQCKKDCISYEKPGPRADFYPDQVTQPANIDSIVKVLHLLQYVINGYSKMITSVTGYYPTKVTIDYTKSGGTTIETGIIRFDINMFWDLIQFLHMFAHESGHLRTMVFNQESTIVIPVNQLSYAIPLILSQQLDNQKNEAEADINAAIVCAIYKVPLGHPYTGFQSQPPLPASQVGQDSHPQGITRAAIMQEVVSILHYHFNKNDFDNNIWKTFAEKTRKISGIKFSQDIPTMEEIFRIYNFSPNNPDQQIRTLQAQYPNLFTNTTRGDYPPPPLVAQGLDKQLASITNPSIPFQQIRRNVLDTTIALFQALWKLAGGQLPFPAWVTAPPSPQTVIPRVAQNLMSPPSTILPAEHVYNGENPMADIPRANPVANHNRPLIIKKQRFTDANPVEADFDDNSKRLSVGQG